jgi:HAD superfamily hydrolase (TIGR01490 family)
MRVHIFDVDYTLIKRSTSWYFLNEACKTGLISFRQLNQLPLEWIRYKIGLANQNFIEHAVSRLAGIDRQALEKVTRTCFIRNFRPNIYAEGAELIRKLRAQGEEVLFATSSFRVLIKPLEDFFALKESIATVLEFAGGKTTGRLAGKALFGKNKKEAVETWLQEHGIPPGELCFYSDSYTDLPLLELAGHPVAVNPDRFLRREAERRNWPILRFRKTLGKGPDLPGAGEEPVKTLDDFIKIV